MPLVASPLLRRTLRVAAYLLLTLAVYWINVTTPPAARLGVL